MTIDWDLTSKTWFKLINYDASIPILYNSNTLIPIIPILPQSKGEVPSKLKYTLD